MVTLLQSRGSDVAALPVEQKEDGLECTDEKEKTFLAVGVEQGGEEGDEEKTLSAEDIFPMWILEYAATRSIDACVSNAPAAAEMWDSLIEGKG